MEGNICRESEESLFTFTPRFPGSKLEGGSVTCKKTNGG